jgi:hypothetical protein
VRWTRVSTVEVLFRKQEPVPTALLLCVIFLYVSMNSELITISLFQEKNH